MNLLNFRNIHDMISGKRDIYFEVNLYKNLLDILQYTFNKNLKKIHLCTFHKIANFNTKCILLDISSKNEWKTLNKIIKSKTGIKFQFSSQFVCRKRIRSFILKLNFFNIKIFFNNLKIFF